MDPTPLYQLPTSQLAGAIIVACAGALIKFYFDAKATKNANRLKRIDRQLELLYGPLLALSYASSEAWKSFRQIHRPNVTIYWDPDNLPNEEEANAWRLWIEKVFMPLNDKIEKVIVEHVDLLEEDSIPKEMLDFCAHVEAYRGVLEQWKVKDFSRNYSTIKYPSELRKYAEGRYKELKQQQINLINLVSKSALSKGKN